jgi:hypothetical protein
MFSALNVRRDRAVAHRLADAASSLATATPYDEKIALLAGQLQNVYVSPAFLPPSTYFACAASFSFFFPRD